MADDPPPEGGQGLPVVVLVAVAVVALLGGAACGFALSKITSDDGDDATAPAASRPAGTSTTPAAPAGEAQEATREKRSAPEAPRRRLLLDWPDGLTAHTVVLVTSSDRPAALRLAREAARSGIEAGLLRADDYNLGSGMWIVFAGRFDTREGASHQATDLAERFPGAYPQLIQPAG